MFLNKNIARCPISGAISKVLSVISCIFCKFSKKNYTKAKKLRSKKVMSEQKYIFEERK